MIPENFREWPRVVINNEDCSFNSFIKIFHGKFKIFEEGLATLRCKQAANTNETTGNRLKKIQLDYEPFEGVFPFVFGGKQFVAEVTRGQCKLTTDYRQIDFIKELRIYGESIKICKKFLAQTLEESQAIDEDKIVIYENNNGHWYTSKEKKPRKMESVIFKNEFIESVLEDIKEFIESEDWYTEMGIPYKRSYLLYGPPGTGKSSFAQALAGHIKYSICFVNCSDKVNDFQFNSLLNKSPKKSIILIEDVDAIFSQRKNTQKNNSLTFSGFLNAVDGVRSQEGRILIMTTNYKERLDPALLRPGRVDQMYEVTYATKFQMEGLCRRFYNNEKLAEEFAAALPENKFSMSMIQGFLLKYRKKPELILSCINEILESDENVKIEKFLQEINCKQVINDFKIEECYTLASARNLPKEVLEKMITKLDALKKGRLLEVIRSDRRNYIKSRQAILKFIQEHYKDEYLQRQLNKFVQENEVKTFYQIRDKAKFLQDANKKQIKQEQKVTN